MIIFEIVKILNFKLTKFAKLRRFSKNCQVLELFIFSIFHITRNFVNTHICSLTLIYFVALSTCFFTSHFSYSRKISLSTSERSLIFKYETSAILKFHSSKFRLPPKETSQFRIIIYLKIIISIKGWNATALHVRL